MKLYDISQEVFHCTVFPGDPLPERKVMMNTEKGDICNLTNLSMCAHNGTHVDAPYHFLGNGKTIDQMPLSSYVGYCYVTFHDGIVSAEDAAQMLKRAAESTYGSEAAKRILIGGKATMSAEGARVLAEAKTILVGNESQTVGPEDAPAEVHYILLGAEVTLLEGIRLAGVPEGAYLLSTAPLNLGDSDGSPCRAVLIDLEG